MVALCVFVLVQQFCACVTIATFCAFWVVWLGAIYCVLAQILGLLQCVSSCCYNVVLAAFRLVCWLGGKPVTSFSCDIFGIVVSHLF